MMSPKYHIRILALAALSIFFYGVLCAQDIELTLDEAIALSLRGNRDILLKDEELKKAKLKIKEARAKLLPSLEATVGRSFTRGLYAKDIGATSTQMTLKQYLYRGGSTVNTIAQNEYEYAVAQALLDKTKTETIFNVTKAFYTLSLAYEFSLTNKGILENAKQHLSSLVERYKNGEASESDIVLANKSVAEVERAYELSRNQVDSGSVLLKYLLALDSQANVAPKMELVYAPVDLAYTEAFLTAIHKRPEIKQYEAQEKADERGVEIARADNRPSVYLSWDYYSRSTTSLTFSPSKGWQDYNVVGATFSWPIFDGFATQAKIQQAIVDLKETRLNKEKAAQDIALELKSAYLALKNAVLEIKFNEAQLSLYKDSLNVIQDKYKAGLSSSLDLDDAGLGYRIAEFNQRQATYDYLLAKSKFEKAVGY